MEGEAPASEEVPVAGDAEQPDEVASEEWGAQDGQEDGRSSKKASEIANLELSYFLGRQELSDCLIRVDSTDAAKDVHAHRVVLSSCAKYFFRKFVLEGAQQEGPVPVVELPPLPQEEGLGLGDAASVLPLVLRYAYSGQNWAAVASELTAESAVNLFALASVLEADSLSLRVFEHIESSLLTASSAVHLLTMAVQLPGSAAASACGKCVEVLRKHFTEATDNPADLLRLCRLPLETLLPLLESEDLNVSREGDVLKVVRRLLRARLQRAEKSLKLEGLTLSGAPSEVTDALKEGTVQWDVFVAEDPLPLPVAAAAAAALVEVPRQRATSEQQEFSDSGEVVVGGELALAIPAALLGPKSAGSLVARCRRNGEALVVSVLPLERLATGKAEDDQPNEITVEATLAGGEPAGTVRFRWNLAESSAPVLRRGGPLPDEGSAEGEEQEGPPVAPSAGSVPFTNEEVERLLQAVRFPHLEHKELLEAAKDPVLQEAGAQPQVLEALSSRLSQYEAVEESSAPSRVGPRPSTVAGRRASPTPQGVAMGRADEPETPSESMNRTQPAAFGHLGATATTGTLRGTGGLGALGQAAGPGLFPCPKCGAGQLQLRQRGAQWCAACSRSASCAHVMWLPSCVAAAALDGHCASCTLNLRSDVRTLSIRVGRDHAAALVKLPGGVDTLRGICIAGCNDALSRLGA